MSVVKNPKRKRVVSETFETKLRSDGDWTKLEVKWMSEKLQPGDRVRVEVTKLERGK